VRYSEVTDLKIIPMAEKPTILTQTTVAKSRLFRIEALEIQFSNGELRHYERLARGGSNGAVLVVPMQDRDTVLLIREYSAGTHRYELGLPKGKVDVGESFFEAANRELKEEIGFGAKQLYHLSTFSLAPSYLEHTTEIILAQDLYPEKLLGDEPEELEVVAWQLADINTLLATGECTEARSIAALFMAREYLASLAQ
jgi:ADP-ribose diphosphatase